jgi:hypothetical protein
MTQSDGELEQLARDVLGMNDAEFKEFLALPKEEQTRVISQALGEGEDEGYLPGEQFLVDCYRRMNGADRQILERVAAALADSSSQPD